MAEEMVSEFKNALVHLGTPPTKKLEEDACQKSDFQNKLRGPHPRWNGINALEDLSPNSGSSTHWPVSFLRKYLTLFGREVLIPWTRRATSSFPTTVTRKMKTRLQM